MHEFAESTESGHGGPHVAVCSTRPRECAVSLGKMHNVLHQSGAIFNNAVFFWFSSSQLRRVRSNFHVPSLASRSAMGYSSKRTGRERNLVDSNSVGNIRRRCNLWVRESINMQGMTNRSGKIQSKLIPVWCSQWKISKCVLGMINMFHLLVRSARLCIKN